MSLHTSFSNPGQKMALPPELWHNIFSYLDLNDLANARLVSKEWWDLINVDRLWKPLLLKRGITLGFANLEKEDAADSLQSCDWAKTCSTYYSRVHSNWRERRFLVDQCPPSTERVVIRLPYMLTTTFDHHDRVVNVFRLIDADFVLSSRLPLPDDGEPPEDPYRLIPQMTCDTVFFVTDREKGYSIIFKLSRGSFNFEKAVYLTNDNSFVSCSVEEELPNFLRKQPHSKHGFECRSATEDTLWIVVRQAVYVWNYHKSELMCHLVFDTSLIFAHFTRNFFYCVQPYQLSVHVHSHNGHRLFSYERIQSRISGTMCWDELGCGFIEDRSGEKVAMYLGASTYSINRLNVVDPLAITVHENLRQAHCFCARDGVASIATASLETGAILKETVLCPSMSVDRDALTTFFEMKVVLGKYLAMHGVDGVTNRYTPTCHLSLYSIAEGKLLWSHHLNEADIVHLSDQFIVTRGDYFDIFEIYNFL